MANWTLYEKRLNLYGSTKRERDINKLQSDIQRKIISSPAHKSNIKIDGVSQSLTILSTANEYIKDIKSLPDESFKLGQLVEWTNKDDSATSNWLITKVDFDTDINVRGEIERSNYTLNFINSKGLPDTRCCIVTDGTKYSMGEKSSNQTTVILGDTRFDIIFQRDDETLQFGNNTRLMLTNTSNQPTVYRVTKFDDVSKYYDSNGLLVLVCTEDQFNAQRDNKELRIADYYVTTVTYKLELLNHDQSTPLLLNTGDTFQLEVQASRNGEVISHRSDNPSYTSTNEEIVTVDSDGLIVAVDVGNCELIIDFFTEKIILHLDVQAGTAVDAYAISIIDSDGDTEIVIGDENDAVVKTYKNGIEDSNIPFEYELLNADGIASIKKVNGNIITISVPNNSKNINKYFDLRVWNDVLGIENTITFKVVGFFKHVANG